MKPKIIDGHPMPSMSECRVRFENCCCTFPSSAMYKSALKKKNEMLGSVLRVSGHFRNASTDAVRMPRLP